jgi:methionyl-tRNA formyltransferase
MRIVFIGAVLFSRGLLTALIESGADIVGVICKPSSIVHSDFATLDDIAEKAGIQIHHTKVLNADDTRAWIKSRRPDVIFCFGWSEMIGPDLRSIPRKGVVGYHPTLLPLHRGRHPIIWALAHGLTETGSTFFLMDDGADSGPILDQRKVAIDSDMDAGELYQHLADIAAEQVVEVWKGLADGTLKSVAQDHSQATYWRKRSEADGVIDWNSPSAHIHNLIRALAKPYPGAMFSYKGKKVTVWASRVHNDVPPKDPPGTVVAVNISGVLVSTGDGAIELTKYDGPTPQLGDRL